MSPPPDCATPPGNSFHFALPPLRDIQPSRDLPSNRTIAPLGAGGEFTSTLSDALSNLKSPRSPYWATAGPTTRQASARVRRRVHMGWDLRRGWEGEE